MKFANFGVSTFFRLKEKIASAIVFNVQYGNSSCQVSNWGIHNRIVSMTQHLTHSSVAHFTRPSFRPKINNQSIKNLLSLTVSWLKVVKNLKKLWLSKSIFYVEKYTNLCKKNFIKEYDFRGTLLGIGLFWKLQFLNHFIF